MHWHNLHVLFIIWGLPTYNVRQIINKKHLNKMENSIYIKQINGYTSLQHLKNHWFFFSFFRSSYIRIIIGLKVFLTAIFNIILKNVYGMYTYMYIKKNGTTRAVATWWCQKCRPLRLAVQVFLKWTWNKNVVVFLC